MKQNTFRVRLGRLACVSLLAAGCASPDGSVVSRLNPFSRGSRVASKSENVDLKDPAALHLAYGRWREQVGDTADARVSYESVLREDPRNVDALIGLARLDYLAGRHDESGQRLAQALRLEPGNARVLAAQGQLFAAQHRWPEAIDQLNAAVLAAPNTTEYRYQLAVALSHSDTPEEALPHFARTVGPAEAHYNLGYLLHDQGRTREAERHLVEALRQRPDLHVAQTLLDEVRGGRGRLTAPTMAAATPAVRHAAAQPPFAERRSSPRPPFARTALAEAPPAASSSARTNRSYPASPFDAPAFGEDPFAAIPASTAGSEPAAARGQTYRAAANAWYPTPPTRQPAADGLTAAQREQLLNQRMVDGSAFSDGSVRR